MLRPEVVQKVSFRPRVQTMIAQCQKPALLDELIWVSTPYGKLPVGHGTGSRPLFLSNALSPQSAPCRWCCSGTPISTEIKDFIGQFAFLDVKPLGDKAYFNQIVSPSLAQYTWTRLKLLDSAGLQHPLYGHAYRTGLVRVYDSHTEGALMSRPVEPDVTKSASAAVATVLAALHV